MTSSSSDSDFHVTFSLPSSAAALLKELADGGNQGLRDLGVVSVHINSPAFHEGCTVSSRIPARESGVPHSANTSSHLDKLSLSCHSFPSQDDLENTRQNIRNYLTMQTANTGNLDYVIRSSAASAPTQTLDHLPRHIPDIGPVNTLGHSLSLAEASQLPAGRLRLDSARSLVSEVDHGHQKHKADAECWKPAGSSYWNWQQNHYRLAYADVAVDGYGPHSGLSRPVSPMYARSPPYAFNHPCSPRLRTGYQMLPPSHFQEPFGHHENERAWQHTSHTTSPYLMNLLHSNSSHAAKNQRLTGPFETVLALPPGQTKKKFHRSRKDTALTRPGCHATDPSNVLGSASTYDGPGTLRFGPGQSSFAFPMAHNVCRPDIVEQNQQIYAAAQSAYVNRSQANAFSAPSHVSTSCLVTSPPAFAMPTSAHAAANVTTPSESVMLAPAHATLTTACAVSTSSVVLASMCSELSRAPDMSAAINQLTSTSEKLMLSSTHAVSTPTHPLSTSHVFLTSAHVMSTPYHALCSSAHATLLPKDVFSVPLCHVMPVSSHIFSDSSADSITKPVQGASAPSLGITPPSLAISPMKQIVTSPAHVTTTRANVISPLMCVGSARISPEFSERQFFRSSCSGAGIVASDERSADWSFKSKIQEDCSAQCSLKETSTSLDTSSHAEQVCNGELEINKSTCSTETDLPLAILPAVGLMGSVHKDQSLISFSSEFMTARETISAKSSVRSISNETITKAIISGKPEDEEPQPDSTVTSSTFYPSSTVDKMLKDTLAPVSSSRTNEITCIDWKGSISANLVSQSPMSATALQKTKKMSSHGQMPCSLDILDLGSDHGKKIQNKSEESGSVSGLLPPVISSTWISQKAAEEMTVSTCVVADILPTIVDNGRLQNVDILVQENFGSEELASDGSQACATIGKQSVCNATATVGTFKPAVDTFVATTDGAEESNGRMHEKDNGLEFAVNLEQTITGSSRKDDCSQLSVVNRSFQTKSDANFSNDMQATVDESGKTSSLMKIATENTLVTDGKMQTKIQNVYANVLTPSNSEQLKYNNEKEIGSNIAVSNNGVESVDAAQALCGNEDVCNIRPTDDDDLELPVCITKAAINNPSSSRENVSCVLLRNTDTEELAANVDSASQNCHFLDGVAGRQTKNYTDNNDSNVTEVVSSEHGTVECVQGAQVNLRLKLLKEECVQKVSHSSEEITCIKKSNVPSSGELCSLPVLHPCEELLQKVTYSEEPQTTAGKEMTGLMKPCVVDGRSLQFGSTSASEGEEMYSVSDVSFSGDERNFMDTTSVFQYAKSSVSEASASDIRATLHTTHILANCNVSLPAASLRRVSVDNDQVVLGAVTEQRCSDQVQPRERSKSADCDITAVRFDATAGVSCHSVGIQPNGLIAEMPTSSEVLNSSDSHLPEQLRTVVSSRTVTGLSRHCVADVGLVSRCSTETVSTFALNSPLHKEVSLSSEALPSLLPLSCLTVKREDELSDREPSSQINCSSGSDKATSAMHSEILHSDSKTVSLSVAPPVAESFVSTSSLEIVPPSAPKSSMSHSCVRQIPVSCASVSASDHVFFGKDARSSVFGKIALAFFWGY